MPQPSARKFGNAIRKCIVENPWGTIATVTTRTTSFGGMGYGDGVFAHISTIQPIPPSVKEKLKAIQAEFEKQADEGNHFIVSLGGEAYPFGGKL